MSVRERSAALLERRRSGGGNPVTRVPAERDAGPSAPFDPSPRPDVFSGARVGGSFQRRPSSPIDTSTLSERIARVRGNHDASEHYHRDAHGSGGFSLGSARSDPPSPERQSPERQSPQSERRLSPPSTRETLSAYMPEDARVAPVLLPRDGLSPRTNPTSPAGNLDASALAQRARVMQEQRSSPRVRSSPGESSTSPLNALLQGSHALGSREVAALLDANGDGGVDVAELADRIASGELALGDARTATEDARAIMQTFDTNGDGVLDGDELNELAEMVATERALDGEVTEWRLAASEDPAVSQAREQARRRVDDRQREMVERTRQARSELSRLNDELDAVKEAVKGPLEMPTRRGIGGGQSLQAKAQALDHELTNGSAWTVPVESPSSWGDSRASPRSRPKARLSRGKDPSKAILARMQGLQVQRSSPSRSSPRRSAAGAAASPARRRLVLEDGDEGQRPQDVRYGHVSVHSALSKTGDGAAADPRMAKRPQSPQRSSSSNAVVAAASPLLQEMLAAASPSVNRLGSPGRARRSPGRGSPGRSVNRRGGSPLVAVRSVSNSRASAHTFVEQLRSLSPGRDGAGSRSAASGSPSRSTRTRGSDEDAGPEEAAARSGTAATASPLTKRASSQVSADRFPHVSLCIPSAYPGSLSSLHIYI
jgi:hypothetical protein